MNLTFLSLSIMVKIMTYRTTHQLLADVLTITSESDRNGVAVTTLCHKSNLSHGRLKSYLGSLTSSGLMNEIEYDGKNTFIITGKGKLYLEEYKRFSDIADSFGLEL